ncbi:MAG: adenylate kinase [Chloroflexi bacterium]|nr:MAG: adenylate kinase [Chloroflexota bacterium]MBL1193676.1 adenylate kinase [Chloroflexota bacterium]NOH10968.1 adenylate kinase [Chloroflexota bacterium]
MKLELGKRIHVVGTTGSGKTTLAKDLSAKLDYPHVELDTLWWDPNWTNPSNEVFHQRVAQATSSDAWVVDGNYSRVRDIVWGQAETIIWLDFPLWLILFRLLQRTMRRLVTKEEIWNGNRENFSNAFLSKESLFVWAIQTYRRRKQQYLQLLAEPKHSHLQQHRLTSPSEVQEFVSSID